MSSSQLIVVRQPEGLAFYPQGSTEPSHSIPGERLLLSPNGAHLIATSPEAVNVYDAAGHTQLLSIPAPGVVFIALSPGGSYLVTCSKPVKDQNGQPGKNLKVWDLSSGQLLLELPQKQVSKDHWPAIHWAGDESALTHCLTNTVHLYQRADGFSTYRKLTVKGITGLAMSPATSGPSLGRMAAFIPEVKGSPASAGVYSWVDAEVAEPQALVRKSFFRTQGAKLLWNKLGSAVLALAYTDFDVTNQSYYGEQKLHYLPADPAKVDKACTVDLKDGPVHDVQWSPSGEHFAVVAGFIPSKVMLFDANCKAVYDFGSGPYSMVLWNPFGRFLAIAGFGNLPGDILFYDKKVSGTCKQMGAVRSPAVTAEWSPDGRYLLTALVAPRLRVDNAFKVFTYHGQQVTNIPFPILYEAAWVPAAPGAHTDRPQSPERLAGAPAPGASASPAAVPAPRGAGYVPPHLRSGPVGGDGGGGAARPQFSLAYDASDKPGRVAVGAAAGRPASAKPGEDFAVSSKTASKNARKRANKKKGEAGAADGDEGGDEGADAAAAPGPGVEACTASAAGLSLQQGAGGPQGQQAGGAAEDKGGSDVAKRIRALQKKLRQVVELKEKLAKEGNNKALTPEQKQKLDGEAELLAELHSIGGSM